MDKEVQEEKYYIEMAKGGDKEALEFLVKKYEQTVYNFAFKICRNKEKAEHTMQETFLSMIKALHQFQGQSKLSTWLYSVVSNHCLLLSRAEKRFSFEPIDSEIITRSSLKTMDMNSNPEKLIEDRELKNILDETIKALPYDYRIVFLLRDVEGFSTDETAKMLKLSVPAVKSRLHRARSFLRDEISGVLPDGSN